MTIPTLPFVLALALLLMLPALRRREARPWAMIFLAVLVLFIGLQALPPLLPGERWLGARWNWAGQLAGGAGVLALAALLARLRVLGWREIGCTWTQRRGALLPAVCVAAVALSLNMLAASDFRIHDVPAETWIYQATLPGLVEEAVFRGLLLALADRAYPRRRALFGAELGAGAAAVTVVFVALHGLRADIVLGIVPPALLYLWLRARTGSLVLPVVVHNLWNLSLYVAHL